MSKVKIQGNASGTGVLTIAAPNTNTDRTITLPDGTGTLLTSVSSSDMPAGSVLQVVQATGTTYEETTSSSYINWDYSNVSITPSSTSSKILVLLEVNVAPYENSAADTQQRTKIYRDGSAISREVHTRIYAYDGTGHELDASVVINYLDSPSTTSSIEYQLYYKMHSTGDRAIIHSASITLMEISA